MKKFISFISIILAATMLFSVNAYAEGWETVPVDLQGGDQGDSSKWETEELPFDNGGASNPTTPPATATKISISKCSISNIKNKTYTGKKLTQSPTVKYGKKTLKKDTDYTLSYANNTKVGSATVTIKGKGNYTGSVKKTFKINPKGTTVSKLSKPKTKQIKVTWKAQKTQTSGYTVQIAENSAFTKNRKTFTIAKNSTTSKTIKSLKKNKKYYIRVRTYKTVSKNNYYSSWSKVNSIKTK